MQSSSKIGAFALSPDETLIYAGNLCGEVLVVSVETMDVVSTLPVHFGAIEVMAAHPALSFAAAMSMDRSVSLIDVSNPHRPLLIERFVFRDIECANDTMPVPPAFSLSQALTFHPTLRRLAVRSGNAGVMELDFSEGAMRLLHCTRFHGDTDLITLRYVLGGDALLSGAGGDVVLSKRGQELHRWDFGNFNLHWFEPVGGECYLIACDELYVIRLDLHDFSSYIPEERLTRDDLEHVTFNRTSNRAFAAGFDGDVYEIDPETCLRKGIAWRAPYKLRWIKTLETQANTLLAYCFNGGIYKVDLARKEIVLSLKRTPNAVWTSVRDDNLLYFAGEGPYVRPVALTGIDPYSRLPTFELGAPIFKGEANSFTKRMVAGAGGLLLGQRLGEVWEVTRERTRMVIDLREEIRDIAVEPDGSVAYACTERGRVVKFDTTDGQILGAYQYEGGEPLWSLAYHPQRRLLATAARRGDLLIIDCASMQPIFAGGHRTARPKRMKWCDDKLFYVQTGVLRCFDLGTQTITDHVADCENTIEDFIWDAACNYLVLVGYRTEVVLCDFKSGRKLCVAPDQSDFSKGLAWVNPSGVARAYPLDFVSFGRTGTAHLFRIHNDRCVALGPIFHNLLGFEP